MGETKMAKRLNPKLFPDYSDKVGVDEHMSRLDCHGVSRRQFVALASYGAVASATAASLGIPAIAVADEERQNRTFNYDRAAWSTA